MTAVVVVDTVAAVELATGSAQMEERQRREVQGRAREAIAGAVEVEIATVEGAAAVDLVG